MRKRIRLLTLSLLCSYALWVIFPIVFEPHVIYYSDSRASDISVIERVKQTGILKVATRLDGVGCFYKRGEIRGVECEVLKGFADKLGVHLNITYKQEQSQLMQALIEGEADVVASDLTPTLERSQFVAFTEPVLKTREALIHRKDNSLKNLAQLTGKTVSVRKESIYKEEIEKLNEQVFVQLLPSKLSTLDIIKGVAEGEWSYTLADEHIARSPNAFYKTLAEPIVFGIERDISFALSQRSNDLRQALNRWIRSEEAKRIVASYQAQSEALTHKNTQKISQWDHYFQRYSEPPFTWVWLAAQSYSESAFKPGAVSPSGAKGLMQLMPETAVDMQVFNIFDPAENIMGGAKYNHWIYKNYWKHLSVENALAFSFASYNAGIGHVLDAQRLAWHSGADPFIWFGSVENFIVELEKEKYYSRSYIKYGYCRGSETRDYVKRIFKWHRIYSKQLAKPPGL